MSTLLFQTWRSKTDLPPLAEECRQTWTNINPELRHRMYDHSELIGWLEDRKSQFPKCRQTEFPFIRTIDAFRYCHLYDTGGLYVDLDFVCLKPIRDLLSQDRDSVIVGSMVMPQHLEDQSIPNAWMYSPYPRHPFWVAVLSILEARSDSTTTEFATGPRLLYAATKLYKSFNTAEDMRADDLTRPVCERLDPDFRNGVLPGLRILAPDYLYPLSWGDPRAQGLIARMRASGALDPQAISRVPTTSRTVAYTYWQYSWREDPLDY